MAIPQHRPIPCAAHGRIIDLRSDTVTLPSQAMREAIARAEVGDDVLGEDPAVNELQRRAAALMGKPAALFVPTGTMANLLAILAQTRPGDAMILSSESHPFNYESGGMAMIGGVLPRTLTGQYGILDPQAVEAAIIPQNADHHFAPTTLIAIENTTNRGGGAIYPIETIAAISQIARKHGICLHCDGARIFNAVVETGIPPNEYAAHADTISFCLSKGLGAPAGSLLVGSETAIDRAHRFRKMLGGGMRQAGILAAAGLYALEHNIDRLREDHARAKRFRQRIETIPGLTIPLPTPTNMVYIDTPGAPALAKRLEARGVRINATTPTRLRAVFHLNLNDEDIDLAAAAFQQVLEDECGA